MSSSPTCHALHGPNVADQALALLLTLTRNRASRLAQGRQGRRLATTPGIRHARGACTAKPCWSSAWAASARRSPGAPTASACASWPSIQGRLERPAFVFSLDKPSELLELLPKADVVVLACPLTEETRGLIGAKQFEAMKTVGYFINVGRGGLVQTSDLVAALEKHQLAGAGLDVTDPEPLPDGHPLWNMQTVVISPHVGGQSPGARDRQWRLYRENVRRFVAGEPLLCVVDKAKGY